MVDFFKFLWLQRNCEEKGAGALELIFFLVTYKYTVHNMTINLPIKTKQIEKFYHGGRISSKSIALAFHFRIFVTADIAFSVGLIFLGSLEPGL